MTKMTSGVRAAGQIIRHLVDNGPASVNHLAQTCGLPRSTTFTVVSDLEKNGLVDRLSDGTVKFGSALLKLGFARYGLSALFGPAQTTLRWLNQHTGSGVKFLALQVGQRKELLRIDNDCGASTTELEARLTSGTVHVASIVLQVDASRKSEILTWYDSCLSKASTTLQAYLDKADR